MSLPPHSRNKVTGRIHKERGDSLVKNLKKEYPALANINGNTKLATLEKKLKVDSLHKVLKALTKKSKI